MRITRGVAEKGTCTEPTHDEQSPKSLRALFSDGQLDVPLTRVVAEDDDEDMIDRDENDTKSFDRFWQESRGIGMPRS